MIGNSTYSSFHLKTRFWRQNDKNFNNFDNTIDMPLDNLDRLEEIFTEKFSICGRSINRIKQVSVCCHSNNFFKATKFFTSQVSLNASMN